MKKRPKKTCKETQLNEVVTNVCSVKASSFLNLCGNKSSGLKSEGKRSSPSRE